MVCIALRLLMPLLTAILRVNKVVSGGDSGAATSVLARKCCFILLLLARTGPNLRSKFQEESIARATSYTLYTLLRAQTRGGKSVRRPPFVVVLFSDNYFLRRVEE